MNYELRTPNYYDVVVIGAGHAGCEAANVSAKLGAKTLLLTSSLDSIGLLACSASFGGPGRGQLLREIDALGGLMPQIADKSAIHYRHSGKDSAVWAPFVISDRLHYHCLLKSCLEHINTLDIKQDTVISIKHLKMGWEIKTAAQQRFLTKTIVVGAGTFLKGRSRQGNKTQKAGRNSEISAEKLADNLRDLGFELGTFSTGTPPTVAIDKDALDSLEAQQYSRNGRRCSFKNDGSKIEQVKTHKTHTSSKTLQYLKDQIKTNLQVGLGPRHCPSLLDKVTKFSEKKKHSVFLQPESLLQKEWLLNGLSMDFDEKTQQKIVNSVRGLKKAQIVKLGYSVSYRFLKSRQLRSTLASKLYNDLFFAGQVTGTNGYEEAAATGLVAGINAALKAKGKNEFIFERQHSFIGVLVDDISSRKLTEPYRILLSRSQSYIHLRSDNADIRLLPAARRLKLISKHRIEEIESKKKQIAKASNIKANKKLAPDVYREVAFIKKYGSYLKNASLTRQKEETLLIPKDIDYLRAGLSKEAIEKLKRFKPLTIGEALNLDIPERSVKALALYLARKKESRR